eukprot:TRINITY_DN6538_c0_g2_i1.p1 TRINITY_DN6538_c0_g2~~TRINITY_DN6538_c0_g2_i1.p1  ORF type:complete len:694 (+),score=134.49 TRINITY_DN6538_c0_g2_i1:250-2331(+)
MILTLAGVDVEDHEATMHQAEMLMREELPDACTALVGSNDLRNLPHANRRICEQFMRSEGMPSADPQRHSAADAADEDAEDDEDAVGAVAPADFPDWHRSQGRNRPLVLMVQATDNVAKDVLRDVLCFWSAVCRTQGCNIPLLLVLGLRQVPHSRASLFEGELLLFHHVATVRLFDVGEVCAETLNKLAEDADCPLALSPHVLSRVREKFIHARQSESHILRMLVLLCEETLARSLIAPLCAPIDIGPTPGKRSEPDQYRPELTKRLDAASAGDLQQLLPKLREAWSGPSAVPPLEATACMKKCLVQAAAEAMAWRSNLVASLQTWDLLLIAAEPLSQYTSPLRRVCALLDVLWPSSSDAQQQNNLNKLFAKCHAKLDCLPQERLQKLFEDLSGVASRSLAQPLQQQVKSLFQASTSQGRTVKELRSGLAEWIEKVRSEYWQPPSRRSRDLFVMPGGLSCGKEAMDAVERGLGMAGEVQLSQLAAADGAFLDAATLFRILECHAGKHMKVADLWCAFGQFVRPSSVGAEGEQKELKQTEEEVKRRFKQGLLTLHQVGIFAPAAGTASQGMSGWRLRKRRMGRFWLQPARRLKPEAEVEVIRVTTASQSQSQEKGEASLAEPAPGTPKPRRTLRPMDSAPEDPSDPVKQPIHLEPGVNWKRLPFARQVQSRKVVESDFARNPKRQRCERIFLGH